jgi:uncharacterized membrane protein YkgB
VTGKMEIQLHQVSAMIHLAIAPAFLLIGIVTQMRVLANRLARIIDRSYLLQQRLASHEQAKKSQCEAELAVLRRRMVAIQRAIALAAGCALLICAVMVALFVDAALQLELDQAIGGLFVLAMLAMTGSFGFFLHEIFIAADSLLLTLRSYLAQGQ